ncbi:hypothetical protein BaRGS_00008205 [Batillaria attramentaria]|uniref:Uncharacterized protein n=1 Tax=Batillaria attramentaria TaxID=370345 RepID=A0ABD0LM90_9CAEN
MQWSFSAKQCKLCFTSVKPLSLKLSLSLCHQKHIDIYKRHCDDKAELAELRQQQLLTISGRSLLASLQDTKGLQQLLLLLLIESGRLLFSESTFMRSPLCS